MMWIGSEQVPVAIIELAVYSLWAPFNKDCWTIMKIQLVGKW